MSSVVVQNSTGLTSGSHVIRMTATSGSVTVSYLDVVQRRSPPPRITVLNPSTNITTTMSVTGVAGIDLIGWQQILARSPGANLQVQENPYLGTTVTAALSISAQISTPATLPRTLLPTDMDTGDASVTGSYLTFGHGQWAEFKIDAGVSGGNFRLREVFGSLPGGHVRILLDNSEIASLVIPSQEEEEDLMPAHTVTEATFTAASGSTATRADLPGSRTAPATRYKVRVINAHPNDRLYVATTQAEAQTTSSQIVEADFGYWEDFLDSNIAIWVRPSGSNAIPVRIVQYATT